jgi:NAD(P)-dependent dehydrogenase (short-subunit alcohol dehydrogenase family)
MTNHENIAGAGFGGATALITGGTGGIGLATARSLAGRGAHVIVTGRGAERGDRAAATVRAAGGKADFVPADLADSGSVRALARTAAELGGGHVDVLINNAGIYPTGPGPTPQTSTDDFDTAYAINVRAPFILVGELAPAMAGRGQGAIVNVLSMGASVCPTGRSTARPRPRSGC